MDGTETIDEKFMRMAIAEARNALYVGEVPIGAVVVSDGRVIGKGHNLVERLSDVTAHAEIQAMTAASEYFGSKYLRDCTLYVTLEPCVMCAGAGSWFQIGRIVYGAPDEKKGYTVFNPDIIHHTTIVESGILHEECSEIVKDFFRNKR